MKRVERNEILDYVTYGERRADLRAAAMEAKGLRRANLAGVLTFLFENHETIRYQVHEMVRAERIVKEADIRHELETYNELIGRDGDIGCTLLVELDDPLERSEKLVRWIGLPEHLYLLLGDGRRVRPVIDERQRTEGKLSTVQYLRFPVGGAVPVAVGCDHPELRGESALSEATRAALARDLAGE
jgi:hypothetical protein